MKQVEKVWRGVSPFPTYTDFKPPHPVTGNARTEEAASEHGVHVFMTCYGYLQRNHKRVLLDKNTPLGALRQHFGQEMQQARIVDGFGFEFHANDLDKPIWKFSTGCVLRVLFVHPDMMRAILESADGLRKKITDSLPSRANL